ncbi:immunity 49 family protein [Streptomyces sp. CA-132043]|uniref:immunity 49 family protein n=1 Tax=Streptomyces sp. CA-132043 TaxID=3240048 RepID=UPI003D8CE38A
MSVRVSRHGSPGPDDEGYATALGKSTEKSTQWVQSKPSRFNSALNKSLLHVQAWCTVDPEAARIETWEATVTAMQLSSAMFAAASTTEDSVQCRVNGELRTIPATIPQEFIDAGNWLTAFWLAVVCREQQRLTKLCEIPLDSLRSPQGQYDEYIYHWVDTLQTYWLRRPGLVDKLVATLEASHPEVATNTPRDLLQHVLYPPINLFHRFVRKDEQGFNEALAESLELHKHYWTADEQREQSVAGMLALGPLAIACLAYDGEIPVEIESEYLPKHLLRRSWLGEFAT